MLDQRGEVWRTLVVLIPTLVASCIAISRIMDARHHPFDVLFGSAMGILVAWGFALVGTFVLLKVVDAITGLRVPEESENEGLDIALHGEEAYNLEA